MSDLIDEQTRTLFMTGCVCIVWVVREFFYANV